MNKKLLFLVVPSISLIKSMQENTFLDKKCSQALKELKALYSNDLQKIHKNLRTTFIHTSRAIREQEEHIKKPSNITCLEQYASNSGWYFFYHKKRECIKAQLQAIEEEIQEQKRN